MADLGSIWVSIGPSKAEWRILVDPESNNPMLISILAFIHNEYWNHGEECRQFRIMKFNPDLKNPMWIHFKGILLAAIGIIAGLLLVTQTPTWKTLFLYAAGTWGFCRFYYYLFHVMERYLGGGQYTGILDQFRHLSRELRSKRVK